MVEEEFKMQEGSAPFNMALATLFALRNILADIKIISADPRLTDAHKQKLKVGLVRRFYVDCSPLLDERVVEENKSILDLKPATGKVIDHGKETGEERVMYDFNLESQLDSYLIKLQSEMQKKNYFMPPRRDMGSAVGF